MSVSQRQAVHATKHADTAGVLGFCGWHAAQRCDEDAAAAAAAAHSEGSDDEHTQANAGKSDTVRQLFTTDRLVLPPPSPNEEGQQLKQAAGLPQDGRVAHDPKPGPVWRTQSWETAQQQYQEPVDLSRTTAERQVELEELRQRVRMMQQELEQVEDQRSIESLEAKIVIDGLRATIREQKKPVVPAQVPSLADHAAVVVRKDDNIRRHEDFQFEQMRMELDRWKDNFAAVNAEREELDQQVSALREKVVQEEAASAAYRDETAALREEVRIVAARAESAERQASAASADSSAARAQVEVAEAAAEGAKAAAAAIEAAAARTLPEEHLAAAQNVAVALAELRDEHAVTLASAQQKYDKRLAAVEAASRVVEDGLREELEEASARLVASEERAAELDTKLTKAEASADEFDDIATALDEQLKERTVELSAVTSERDQLKSIVEELQLESRALRATGIAEDQISTASKSAHNLESDLDSRLRFEASHRDELHRLQEEAEKQRQALLDEKDTVSARLEEAQKKSEKVVEGLKATISSQGEELEQLKQQLQASAKDRHQGAVDDEAGHVPSMFIQAGTQRPVIVRTSSQHGRANPQRSGSFEYADDDEADDFSYEINQQQQQQQRQQQQQQQRQQQAQPRVSQGAVSVGAKEGLVGLAVVRTEFVAEEIGDLGLEVGETICLLKAPRSKQWWKGNFQTNVRLFI